METHNQSQFFPSIISNDSSSFSNPFFLDPSLEQGTAHGEHDDLHGHQEQQELHDLLSIGGSSTHHVLDQKEQLSGILSIGGSSNHPILEQKQQLQQEEPNNFFLSMGGSNNFPIIDQTSGKRNQHESTGASVKWMSSKMRLMRKMLSGRDQTVIRKQKRNSKSLQEQVHSNQETNNINGSPSGIIRVCSNCNTTKTPLWRSGPQGPKSLCNACGIRQMKARRAMRAAAAAGLSSSSNSTECKMMQKQDETAIRILSDVDRTVPFKKRFKITSTGTAQKKLRFDEVAIKKRAFHQAFPQEERDAAILLMGLSCGLIHG